MDSSPRELSDGLSLAAGEHKICTISIRPDWAGSIITPSGRWFAELGPSAISVWCAGAITKATTLDALLFLEWPTQREGDATAFLSSQILPMARPTPLNHNFNRCVVRRVSRRLGRW